MSTFATTLATNALALCILVASVGCSSAPPEPKPLAGPAPATGTPTQRYVHAVDLRLQGDAHGYLDELIALAHEHPTTRAGRKARAVLQSGGMLPMVGAVGIAAAVAVPNFIKYQARARQAVVKTELRRIAQLLQLHRAGSKKPCSTFEACGVSVPEDSRYLFFLNAEEVIGGGGDSTPDLLRIRATALLNAMKLTPVFNRKGFLLVAVGNIDDDVDLDIWTVDDTGMLRLVADDLK